MSGITPSLESKANPQQLEAILATEGPVLIIAGPGSGKTFTLVERIVYLITAQRRRAGVAVRRHVHRQGCARTHHPHLEPADRARHPLQPERDVPRHLPLDLPALLEDYREFTRLKRSFTLLDQFDQQYFLYQRIKRIPRTIPTSQLVMGDDQTGPLGTVGEPAQVAQQGQRRSARRRQRWRPRPKPGSPGAGRRASPSTRSCSTRTTRSTSPPSSTRPCNCCEQRPEVLAQPARKAYLPDGRRVPGHQHHPGAHPAAAGRREAQPLRRGRRRPGPVPLSRRHHPQHPGVPRRCSTRASASASPSRSTTAPTRTSSASTTDGWASRRGTTAGALPLRQADRARARTPSPTCPRPCGWPPPTRTKRRTGTPRCWPSSTRFASVRQADGLEPGRLPVPLGQERPGGRAGALPGSRGRARVTRRAPTCSSSAKKSA